MFAKSITGLFASVAVCHMSYAAESIDSAWRGTYLPPRESQVRADVGVTFEDPWFWGPKLILRKDTYVYWPNMRNEFSVTGHWNLDDGIIRLQHFPDKKFWADEERGVKLFWLDRNSKERWKKKGDINRPKVLLRVESSERSHLAKKRPSIAEILDPVTSGDLSDVLDHIRRGWPESRLLLAPAVIQSDSGRKSKELLDESVRLSIDRRFSRLAKRLVELGGDPNAIGESGNTPLMLAISNGDFELAEVVVAKGCNVEIPELKYWTGAEFAYAVGEAEIAELLINNGSRVPDKNVWLVIPLCRAAYFGNIRELRLLLLKGAAVNGVDPAGRTAISYAAESGNESAIELLVEFGGDRQSSKKLDEK